MNALSLPIVHPAFEKLKRSGKWLHFIAGLLILTHALTHVHQQESNSLYFWCQLILSLDIFILVIAGKNILIQLPKVNLFFRLVEILFFLGIGIVMLWADKWVTGFIHLGLSIAYCFLFYCERTLNSGELLSFHHTGVSIPGIPESRFLLWSNINDIEPRYDSIHIETSTNKNLNFDLRKNLSFEQLEQIHEFCRHYLGKSS